jgi:hypothetical protein
MTLIILLLTLGHILNIYGKIAGAAGLIWIFRISAYEEGKLIKLKNNNDIDIKMEGWVLAAHGENPSFEFDPEFEWKRYDEMEIAINNNDEKNPQKGMFWNIKELNNQTIFTMQNANNITVAQWSPELSSDSC